MIPADLSLSSLSVGHFPVVRAAMERLGMLEVLGELLPKAPRSDVSDTDCITVMVMNILQGRVALYRMDEWLSHYDTDVLLGEGVRAAAFHDTRLGAAIDHLFDIGTDTVISAVARRYLHSAQAPKRYSIHGDTTSLALQGLYEVIPDEGAPLPTFGYSKDKRPDLKQVIFGLTLHGPTAMPLVASVLDGNTSEQKANRLSIDQLASLLRPDDEVTLVADCKLVDPVTLGRVLDEKFHFISLMPDTYALRQALITKALAEKEPMPELAREPGRTKKDPPHIYAGRSYETVFPIQDPHLQGAEGLTTPPLRALVVSSPQLRAKFDAGLERMLQREVEHFERALRKANREPFRCEPDATTAIETLLPALKLQKATVVVLRHEKVLPRKTRGRPKKGEEAQKEVFYTLSLQEIERNEAAIAAAREQAGHFILLTSHTDTKKWSDQQILAEYRRQHLIEGHCGFRWFKDEAKVAPVFLKTPRRIAGLCAIFVLALMVRNYLQEQLRRQMAELDVTLPYYDRRRETKTPTAELLFDLFAGLQVIVVTRAEEVLQRQLGKLDPGAKTILDLLHLDEALFTTVRPKLRPHAGRIP